MAWNSLPDNLRDPSHCSSSFRRDLFCETLVYFSTIEMLHDIALYKLTIDIDIDICLAPPLPDLAGISTEFRG